MTRPARIPVDEAKRLARLKQLAILDTRPEPIFDALTRLAASTFDVPIALVSLVDAKRQWFKSNFGLPEASETPREIAFCSHAILGNQVMEVQDATLDDRFKANPLVTGDPSIRFYAGAPITLSDGYKLGTVCIIDRQPKRLTDEQTAMLAQLATVVSEAMEFRGRAIRAVETATRDQMSLQNLYIETPAMLHAVDTDGKLLTVSAAWLAELGYDYEEAVPRHIADFFAPGSRDRMLREGLPTLWREGQSQNVAYEMVRKDGSIFDVLLSSNVEQCMNQPPRCLTVVTQTKRFPTLASSPR